MKTLYVSDLDGTLLRQNERTSDHTNAIINQCVQDGMLFSYATARSWHTAKKATADSMRPSRSSSTTARSSSTTRPGKFCWPTPLARKAPRFSKI